MHFWVLVGDSIECNCHVLQRCCFECLEYFEGIIQRKCRAWIAQAQAKNHFLSFSSYLTESETLRTHSGSKPKICTCRCAEYKVK